MLLLRLAMCGVAVAYLQYAKPSDEAVDFTLSIPDIDVGALRLEGSLPDPVRQALDMIKNVESLPACAKIATSALLHSCSALDGSLPDGGNNPAEGMDLLVEEEVDIYAARLAVCELKGADFAVPYDCRSFIPSDRSTRKRGIRGFWSKTRQAKSQPLYQYYDEITQENLKQCRNALSSTPQTWTSYSNNRQNAVVLCRGMRSEIEKDQQIHLARILAGVSVGASESLHDAAQRYDSIKAAFQDVVASIPAFHQAIATNHEQLAATRRLWEDLSHRYDRARDVADELARLLEESKINIRDMDSRTDDVTQSVVRLVSVIDSSIAQQERGIDSVSAETAAIIQRLHTFQNTVKDTLIHEVGIAGGQVASYTVSLAQLGGQVEALVLHLDRQIAERDSNLDSFFERQKLMFERVDEQWGELQNLTNSIHETLRQALPMAQTITSVGRILVAWLEGTRRQLFGLSTAAIRCATIFSLVLVALTRSRTMLRCGTGIRALAAATIAIALSVVGQSLVAVVSTISIHQAKILPMINTDTWQTHEPASWFADRDHALQLAIATTIAAVGVCVAALSYALHQRLHANRSARSYSTHSDRTAEQTGNAAAATPDKRSRLAINDPRRMVGKLAAPWIAPQSGYKRWAL